MKKSEFKKLIREEIKKTLNEATTYPIGIQEITIKNDRLTIIIGNSSADLIGFKPSPDELSKLDTIMKSIDSTAKRVSGPKGVQFTGGQLRYQLIAGASIYPARLLKAIDQVNALNMTHTY